MRTPSPPARGRGRSPGGCSHGPSVGRTVADASGRRSPEALKAPVVTRSSGPRTAMESVANADANARRSASVGETSTTSPIPPDDGVVAPPKEAPPPARSTASTSIASPATSVWAPPPPKVAITSTRSPGRTPTAEATGTSTARIPAGTTEAVGPDRAPASRRSVTISPAAMSATAILPVARATSRSAPGGANRDGNVTISSAVSVSTAPRARWVVAATTATGGPPSGRTASSRRAYACITTAAANAQATETQSRRNDDRGSFRRNTHPRDRRPVTTIPP